MLRWQPGYFCLNIEGSLGSYELVNDLIEMVKKRGNTIAMSNSNKHIKIGLRVTVVLSLLIAGFWLWWDRTYGEVPDSVKIWWP